MIANYFIDRPKLAWVVAIITMLLGLLALRALPVAQFPDLAAPAIEITATYPGADAQTVETTVTQIPKSAVSRSQEIEVKRDPGVIHSHRAFSRDGPYR